MPKIKNIEFLRIILMSSIVLYHLFQERHLGNLFPAMQYTSFFGDKAVEMFFIISGFLLAYTFKQATSVFKFITKKVIRFIPLMLCVHFAYWVLSCFTNYKYLKYDNILDLFFLSSTGMALRPSNLSGIWFISVLVFVSLFYFCLMKYFNKNHANLIIGLITYFSFVVLINTSHGSLAGHVRMYNDFITFGMLKGLACIGLGYLVYRLHEYVLPAVKKGEKKLTKIIVYTGLEIYLLIFLINNLIFHRISFNNKIILIIAFVLLFWLFLQNTGWISKFASKDIFSEISKYTFSIYLTHLYVYKVLSYTLWDGKINVEIIAILTLIIAITVGVIAYHVIEYPCYRFLIKKLEDIEKRRVAE